MMDKKDDEVREQLKEIMRRERANTGRLNITVRNVARDVIKANAEYYSDDLLQLIPKEILGTELTDNNLHETGLKIDNIRRDMQRLRKAINEEKGPSEFNPSQKQKIKEIKFLSKVAQTIIHQ
jgi:hypothetical protein